MVAKFHQFEGHMDDVADITTRFNGIKNEVKEFNADAQVKEELDF